MPRAKIFICGLPWCGDVQRAALVACRTAGAISELHYYEAEHESVVSASSFRRTAPAAESLQLILRGADSKKHHHAPLFGKYSNPLRRLRCFYCSVAD